MLLRHSAKRSVAQESGWLIHFLLTPPFVVLFPTQLIEITIITPKPVGSVCTRAETNSFHPEQSHWWRMVRIICRYYFHSWKPSTRIIDYLQTALKLCRNKVDMHLKLRGGTDYMPRKVSQCLRLPGLCTKYPLIVSITAKKNVETVSDFSL